MNEQHKFSLAGIDGIHDQQRHAVNEQDAESPANDCRKQALRQQHTGELATSRTQCETNGDFTTPRDCARKKKHGHVAACQQ